MQLFVEVEALLKMDTDSDEEVVHKKEELMEMDLRTEFRNLLTQERFDAAIDLIVKMRDDRKLRRISIREYISRLGPYLQRLKPEREITDGWLTGENSDFSLSVENAVAQLGNEFFAILIEECAKPAVGSLNGPNRYLVNFFMELTQDGYCWNDVINFCLTLVAEDRKRPVNFSWDEVYEKLSNVRQFIAESPNFSMQNPLSPAVRNGRKRTRQLDRVMAVNANSIFEGKSEISLDDITKEIVIARSCATLLKMTDVPEFKKPNLGKVDVVSLAKNLMQNKLYHDAVLLAAHTKMMETTTVFASFTEWIIHISVLAIDQWEEFSREIEPFLQQMDLLSEEKIFHRGREAGDIFIERILNIVQNKLVDLFLELGTLADLQQIIGTYVQSGYSIFPSLQRMLVSPRYFTEVMWILLKLEGTHDYIFALLSDWVEGFSSKKCLGSAAPLSFVESDVLELPFLTPQLLTALQEYFSEHEMSDMRLKWESFEKSFNSLREKHSFLIKRGSVALPYQRVVYNNSPSNPDD